MAALQIFARSNLSTIFQSSLYTKPLKTTSPTCLQVHKRWSNYKTSPVYKDPSQYMHYEITTDPKEWVYVERLLRIKQIPLPPPAGTECPSGYRPASAKPTDYPYFVKRSKNYMQPVYLATDFRGARRITHLRNIQGNIWALEAELRQYLKEATGKTVGMKVNEMIGDIKVRGDFVSRVQEFLNVKGF